MPFRLLENGKFLFGVLLTLQTAYFIWAVTGGRSPAGHDGFQYFSTQYYFLNNAVQTGEVAQWMPFMTQGTVASWWYAVASGFLANALYLAAPILKGINYFFLFHAGMFMDELILLAGCWYWGMRVLKTPLLVFFFSSMVCGTALWWVQPWHDFHLYYCLPLVIYLLHRFFDTGRWVYAVAAGDLLIMALLGSMPYFLPIMTFVVGVYFVFWFLCGLQPGLRLRRGWWWKISAVCLVIAGVAWIYLKASNHGTELIVSYNIGRLADGTTPLKEFLNYGGHTNWSKWKELYIGFSPEEDYTVYGGLMLAPLLIALLCFCRKRDYVPPLLTAAVLLDFSSGGLTAKLAYHAWPMMKFYRHISLSVSVVKIFLSLSAAFAVGYFLRGDSEKKLRQQVWVLAVLMGVLFAAHLKIDHDVLDQLVVEMTDWGRSRLFDFQAYYDHAIMGRLAFLSWLSGGICLFWVLLAWVKSPGARNLCVLAIVMLHAVDIYSYKFYEAKVRSMDMRPFIKDTAFTAIPYAVRRQKNGWKDHPRAGIIRSMPLQTYLYWSNDTFLFRDACGHDTRTDHWLIPLDDTMRFYWGMDINDKSASPKGLDYLLRLNFPVEDKRAAHWAGVSADKVQFFDGKPELGMEELNLPLRYHVINFNSDHLSLEIDTPAPAPVWLFYSNVYHPQWKVTVDGKPQVIARSALAYQTVLLPKHARRVDLNFHDNGIDFLRKILSLNAVCWLLVVGWMVKRVLI